MNRLKVLTFLLLVLSVRTHLYGQEGVDTTKKLPGVDYIVQKFDGNVFVGRVVYEDPRVIRLQVKKLGEIYIKKNDIEVIREMNKKELLALAKYTPGEVYSTRYFINSNALPVNKGENYGEWNWYGPDLHMSPMSNTDVSVSSSWVAFPILANVRYNVRIMDKAYLGLGMLGGWGSWSYSDCSGVIPYASLSAGDRRSNITLTGGYALMSIFGLPDHRPMCSLAFMKKAGNRSSVMFDSFIFPSSKANSTGINLFIPGMRFQWSKQSALQLGLGGLVLSGTFIPAPIPFVSWFRHF
jgi:hypothetical protein